MCALMIIKLTESSFYLFVRNLWTVRDHRQKYTASESSYRVKTAVLDPNRCASTPCRSLLFNNTLLGWQRILRDTARLTQVANRFAVLTGLGSGRSYGGWQGPDLYVPLYSFPREKKSAENGKIFFSLSLSFTVNSSSRANVNTNKY